MAVSDNLKSGIRQECFYEPTVNRSHAERRLVHCRTEAEAVALKADRSCWPCGSSRGRDDVVLDRQGRKSGDDHGKGGVLGPEAFNQGIEIRKLAVVESEFGVAGTFTRERQKAGRGAAG
jgi:hypothetical protein